MAIRSRSGPAGPASTTFHPHADALVRWQREWERWSVGPRARAGLRRWAADPVLAAHVTSIEALCAACGRDRAVPSEVADRRLAALAGKARDGDAAAGRVVLQRVMPALTERAGRRAVATRRPFDEAFTDVMSTAWVVISGYPLERRPARIAATIVWQVENILGYVPVIDRHTLLVADPPELPTGLDGARLDVAPNPSAELLRLLRDGQRDGVSPGEVRLLGDLALGGARQHEVAARGGITARMVRHRRAAAVRSLTTVLVDASPPADPGGQSNWPAG